MEARRSGNRDRTGRAGDPPTSARTSCQGERGGLTAHISAVQVGLDVHTAGGLDNCADRTAASPSRILAVDTSMRPRSRNWALMAALVDELKLVPLSRLGAITTRLNGVASPTERVGLGDDVSNHRNGGIGVHRRWRCRTTAPGYHREHRNQANQRGQRATPHAVVLDFSSRRHIHPFDMQGTRRAYPSGFGAS